MAVLALALAQSPTPALAAVGPITTSAQGVRISVGLLGGLASVNVGLPTTAAQSWSTGQPTASGTTASANLGTNVLGAGVITTSAGPVTGGGGQAQAKVAGLNTLGLIGADGVNTACQMTASGITTTVDIANLRINGVLYANPDANLAVNLPGVLSAILDHRRSTWNANTGRLDYTVTGLDVTVLGGLAAVANGTVKVSESTCSGIVRLGTVTTTSAQLSPGQSATPSVTVTNTGDIAAPNTTIKIPVPAGSAYTISNPTTTGGGTCAVSGGFVTCTGVTVPGAGSVKVSLPVSLSASAGTAADWAPTTGQITAVSKPITNDENPTQIAISGAGTLISAQAPITSSGAITVTPTTFAAGRTGTATVRVTNNGPSDATTTVRIPITGLPDGVSVTGATVGGNACTLAAGSLITCSGVTVPGNGSATVNVAVAATNTTAPGTSYDLTGVTATLNGTALTGQGRLLNVTTADVNLTGGVSITPATAIPGGAVATASVRVANSGTIAASPTTITLPAPPAGYTVGTVSTSGGGTCASTAGGITCTGVSVPAGGSVTVSVPVALSSGTTADWVVPVGTPATATSGDSTGSVSGTLVTATPRFTLGVTANGPADNTISPGQSTTMAVDVYNQGPSDARPATFAVVAPQNTVFGQLTGSTAQVCTAQSLTLLSCSTNLAAGASAASLTLPLTVSLLADPNSPVTGGCVSLDADTTCGGPTDAALPTINLRTPLASRLTTTTTPDTITPGTSGTGRLGLTSTRSETGMTVTIPTTSLPNGFTVSTASVPGGACTVGGAAITCTGVNLTANTRKDVSVGIAVAGTVTPPAAWTPTGIIVTAGNEQVTTAGALAGTGTVSYSLGATVTVPADGAILPGGNGNLTVNVTNAGPSTASNASFTVTAPNGTGFGPLSGTAASLCQVTTSILITCTTTLAANASTGALTFPITVAPNADPDTRVSGGCVDMDGIPGCGSNDRAIPSFALKVPFSAQIGLTADRADVTPGGTATATVHVQATHNALTGIGVTIPLPSVGSGLSVTNITGPSGAVCGISGSTATCTGISIANGATADLGLTVLASSAANPGTTWTANPITVSGGSDSLTFSRDLARVTAARAVLDAVVTAPAGALLPGSTGNLGVVITDTGPSDATGSQVNIFAPAGASFGPLTGTTANTCTLVAPANTRATCTITMAAGAAPINLSLPLVVDLTAQPGKALSGGCVDLDGSATCTVGVDKLIPSISIGTPLQQRLTLTTTPARIAPGEDADAIIGITSTRSESGLTLTVPYTVIPPGVSVTAASVGGNPCTLGGGATPITCSSISVPSAGTVVPVTLRVAATANAAPATWTVTNMTVASLTESATETGDLAVVGAAKVTLTATAAVPAAGTVSPGGTATVTVAVTNGGPSAAAPATFTVTAPTGTTFGSPLPVGCTATSSTVATCTATLAPNAATGSLSFPVQIPANADPFTTITGGCVDLDGASGCGSGDVAIAPITLKVALDRLVTLTSTPATPTPGGTDTATVSITAGANAVNGLTLTVPLAPPSGLNYDAIVGGGPGTCAAQTGPDQVVCTGVNVAAGATQTLTLRLRATSSAASGTTWTATGITVTKGGETVTANRLLATTGAANVTLNPTITVPGPILPGGTGSLSIDIQNTGTSDATNAPFGIVAPAGTSFGTLPSNCQLVAGSTTRATCTVTLAGGATTASPILIPLVVDASAAPGASLTGGCVDLDADGYCTAGTDRAIGAITVATPLDRDVSITTDPSTVGATSTGNTADVVVTSVAGQTGLTVTIPLTGLPSEISNVAATPDSGICTPNGGNTAIVCTGFDVTAGANNPSTVELSFDVTGASSTFVWSMPGIQVADNVGGAGHTVTGGGVLARTTAPAYTLAAGFTPPTADSVLPGTTAMVALNLSGTGTNATGAPITLRAPDGTTFGTPLPTGCTAISSTVLSCAVDVTTSATTTLNVPVVVPNPAPGATITGGCVDLTGNGVCDTAFPSITLREPLGTVITIGGGSTTSTLAPGTTGTATILLDASALRNGLTFTLPATSGTGITITAADLGGAACTIAGNVVTCTGASIPQGGTVPLNLTLTADANATAGTSWNPPLTVSQTVGSTTDSNVLRPAVATLAGAQTLLTVSVSPPANDSVLPGGVADLGVTMSNAGPSALPRARAAFKAPNGTTFATPLDAPASTYCTVVNSTLVTCEADLGVGSKSFVLPLDVPSTTTAGTTISGGCIDLGIDGSCDNSDPVLASFTLGKSFPQQIQAVINGGTVVPGSTGSGVIRVTADRQLANLTVTVPLSGLPTGLTVSGASGPTGSTCTLTGTVTCTGVTVPQATTNLITVTMLAASSMSGGVSWTPTATLSNSAGEAVDVIGTMITTGAPAPGLAFDVAAPAGTVAPGGQADMAVTVTNPGPSDANATITRIKAPNGTTFGTLTGQAATDCTAVGANQLDCRTTLAAGGAPVRYTLPVLVPANADPDTDVTGGCIDVTRDGGCGTGDTPLPTLRLTPTLAQSVTISTNNPTITPGRTGAVTVTLAATRTRTGLTVTVPTGTLPTGVTVTGAQVAGGTCTVAGGNVTCTGVGVTANGTTSLTLNTSVQASVVPGTTWAPTITVSDGTQQTARTTTAVTVGAADTAVTVAVAVPAAGSLKPGDTGTLTATVSNSGSSLARNVPYAFLAPTGTTFLAPTGTTATQCTQASSTRLNCRFDVNGNARTVVPLPIQVAAGADPNTPLSGGCADAGSDGVCTVPPDTRIPDITLATPLSSKITVSGVAGSAAPGATSTGTVRIVATSPVSNATITIPLSTLPAGVTVNGASGPSGSTCAITTGQIQCTGVNLTTGTNAAVSVTTRTGAAVAGGTAWRATGITIAAGPDTVTSAADLLTVSAAVAPVTYRITGPTGSLAPGEVTTLSVAATNPGPSNASGKTITVVAPAHTRFGALSGAAAQNCTQLSTTQLSCRYDLAAGSSLTWNVPLVVDSSAANGDRLANGCISTDGNTTCGDAGDVAIVEIPVSAPLSTNGTVTVATSVIEPGATGTATVSLSSTATYTGLTLSVPLAGLPTGMTVTGATIGGTACTVGTSAITCSGVALTAGTAKQLRLSVAVADTVAETAAWRATGITLTDAANTSNKLTTSGVLVTTTAAPYTVSVTTGTLSAPSPASGQSTVLPITVTNAGPGAARPYPVTVMIPAGARHGELPSGCVEGSTARTVVCRVNLAAGDTTRIDFPLVVDEDAKPDQVVDGGCLDQALSTGAPAFDLACGGTADVAIPSFTVGRHAVNLAIEYGGAVIPATAGGGTFLVRVPYVNDGTRTAADVRFTVAPPAGVTVRGAAILVDAATGQQSIRTAAAATDANTVDATCVSTGTGTAVSCRAPNSAALSGSQLWLTLQAGEQARSGLHKMKVTVTTSSADGNSTDNMVEVPLMLKAASTSDGDGGDGDNGDGDNGDGDGNGTDGDLPTTGQQITGMVLLAGLMVMTGFAVVLLARERVVPAAGPVAGRRRRMSELARRWGRRRHGDG